MNTNIGKFLDKVRTAPRFVEAAGKDPALHRYLCAVETALEYLETKAGEDPAYIDALDEIRGIVSSEQQPIKDRLVQVLDVFKRLAAVHRLN